MIRGNYWVDLIEREKNIKKEIQATISKSIGKKFSDYNDMTSKIKNDIRKQVENYGVAHHMGVFNLEYDLDLKYDNNFVLTGYEIKFVYLEQEEPW